MSWFELIVVQPIFNILMAIYALLPGHDFGLAVIVFAVIIRLLMWPLVRQQLHQAKLQRAIQPELKKIKAKAKGNRQLEGQLMLELYRERGVNPFAPFKLLIVQIPVFIALFQVITMLSSHRDKIESFIYAALHSWQPLAAVIADPAQLNEHLLGLIDLTKPALHNGAVYWPVILLAVISAYFQYYQSKQITPVPESNKKLRDVLRESASGKQADQAEISAIMGQNMIKIIPFVALFSMVLVPIPGALILFYAATSIVAVIQQRNVMDEDIADMETLASKKTPKKPKTAPSPKPAQPVIEGEVVSRSIKKPNQKRRKGSKVR